MFIAHILIPEKRFTFVDSSLFFFSFSVYEFGVTIPDYTMYLTTGITVALAWNLPDKPTYPEQKHKNHLMLQHKNDANSNDDDGSLASVINTKSNATRRIHLKSSKNDIINRLANYAEHYFRNRRPDSYYFGHSLPFGRRNSTNHYHYSSIDAESSGSGNDIRPSYSTAAFHSKNPPNNAMYMIETYFKPWIKSLEIATELA